MNTIDPFSIDRMEVLYGSGSVQYGSDAFGGTIQMFSQDAPFSTQPEWGGTLLGRIVSQGMEQSIRAESSFSSERMAATGGWSGRFFGDLVGGDTTGRQTPSGYHEQAFDVKIKTKTGKTSTLTAAHQQLSQMAVPVYHKVQLENYALNEFDPQFRSLSYLKNDWTPEGKTLQNLSLTLAHQYSKEGRNSRKNNTDILRNETDRVRTISAILQARNQWSDQWSANSGIELYHDLVLSQRNDTDQSSGTLSTKRGLYPDGATMLSYALFSLHEFNLQAWTFEAGLRWNRYSIRVRDTENKSALLQPSALVGNAGVVRKLGSKTAVFAAFNTGFRTPNIDDLGTLGIVDFRYEVPNFNLKPEKSYNTQVGARMFSSKYKASLVVYRNELRDLINRVKQDTLTIQGYPVYGKENTGKAYIQGLEGNFQIKFTSHWQGQAGISYTYGENISQQEPMRRIPPLFGSAALRYRSKRWFASATLLAASKQDRLAAGDVADNRIPAGGTPGWSVLNLACGYEGNHLRAELVGVNLSNTDYRYHGSGINGQGRSTNLVLAWRF
ncbi:MAG: TonB-dependent receptor [Lewinellaceae bacterium]|nr:TonB-dependent receptor [Lewinellaceae bacterium]